MTQGVLAIDIGYGDVKVFDGERGYKFPTAVAPYSFSSFTNRVVNDKNSPFADEVVFTFEGLGYVVGERALHDPDCMATRSYDFILKYTPLFVYKVIKDIGHVPSTLALGIPLGRYISKNSEVFKQEYVERVRKFVVNKEVVEIENVEIYAQGHGIYIDYLVNGGENAEDGDNAVVVDIGFNTVDILFIDNGTPTKKNSGTLTGKGVVVIVNDLDEYLRDNYDLELSEQALKDVLMKKRIKIYGDEINLVDVITEITATYTKTIINDIESKLDKVMKSVNKIIFAGGGAHYVRGFIPDRYRKIAYVPDSPEFANVRGYYNLSLITKQRREEG